MLGENFIARASTALLRRQNLLVGLDAQRFRELLKNFQTSVEGAFSSWLKELRLTDHTLNESYGFCARLEAFKFKHLACA